MVNFLVAYSNDENSSDNASSQGEENPSIYTVTAQGEENQPTNKPSKQRDFHKLNKKDHFIVKYQKLNSAYITTTSHRINSTTSHRITTTTSHRITTTNSSRNTITTTTKKPSSSPSQKPTPQNLPNSPLPPSPHSLNTDDILLSTLHPQKPRRPRKHIAVKQVRAHQPITQSANVFKPTGGATSSGKRRRLGKSHVHSYVSPMILDSESYDCSEVKTSKTPQSKSKSAKRNVNKFLKVERKNYFQTKTVLRGRTFYPDILSMDIVKQVCELLRFQGWEEIFLEPNLIYEQEVVDFYTNLKILEGDVVSSSVKGFEIVFDATKLGEILHIPPVGIIDYHWVFDEHSSLPSKFSQGRVDSRAQTVLKERIDWPTLIIKHFARIVDPQLDSHQLAFGNLLTRVFNAFEVPFGEGRVLTRANMFTQAILVDCGIPMESEQVANASPRSSGLVAQLLRELKVAEEKYVTLELEN
ncbi:hypothetical protein EJD97_024248 [Solanum chilense]|uniref:Uncharacterized protein n=1 Tax=Solanum chilense TaxID=4083 RepID=A0A6N2AT07_SOLCI|nr:hypothetical protein EJD97_024248 [Solanum chilense]